MESLALVAVLATIVAWCVLAGRLQQVGLTAPIVFVAGGWVFADVFGLFDLEVEPELVKVIAEVTLVWVLFADASRVRLGQFRRDLSTYVRLLGVGLPLTIAVGAGAAMVVLGFDPWAALLVGAALAPTDAALGAPVMSNPHVPAKVQSALNVESGLNDGIATPIVLVAIAGVASRPGDPRRREPGRRRPLAAGRPGGRRHRRRRRRRSHQARPRARLAVRGARRPCRTRTRPARLHRGADGGRERVRRRLRGRPGLRERRRTQRREGGLLRRPVRRHGLDDQLARSSARWRCRSCRTRGAGRCWSTPCSA